MTIIHFPGSVNKVEDAQTSENIISKLVVSGPLSFTCTSCNEVCQCDFTNMIFRSVDFHCGKCGTFFKITNPAFTIKKK